MQLKKIFPTILLVVLTFYASLFFIEKQDFLDADLGRHIVNGREIISKNFDVLYTNYYSYTHKDYIAYNHHWLTGVIFYKLHQLDGFEAISILTYLIYSLTIVLALSVSKTKSLFPKLLTLAVGLPLFISRNQARPEMFSYLGIVLFIFLIEKYKSTHNKKYLYFIPPYMLFWVNLHIYFVFGLFVLFAYFIEGIYSKNTNQTIDIIKTGLFTLVASLANPFGARLIIEPFLVLNNYGFEIAENQTAFMFLTFFDSANLYQFIVVSFYFIYLASKIRHKKYFQKNLSHLFIPTTFSILGFIMVRNVVLFGYTFLCFFPIIIEKITKKTQNLKQIAYISVAIVIPLAILSPNEYYKLNSKDFGFGVKDGSEQAAKFIQENNIAGPIYNNFDIGGYLIYQLYPKEKVFVDNRPKEYPASFFEEEYLPMQQDEIVWYQMEQKYKFKTIIYNYHELAVWKDDFLDRRLADPTWDMVYKDDYGVVIFTKKEN